MRRPRTILTLDVCPRNGDGGAHRSGGRRRGALLEALDELFEAFVVDADQLSAHQERAAREAERLLDPYWRELAKRRAARKARRVA